MIDDVSGVADYQCNQILRERCCRVSPLISTEEPIAMDDRKKRDELIEIADKYVIDHVLDWLRKKWV